MSDTVSVLIWWSTIFIIGIIFLPLTTSIFRKFIDRGYIFTKIIGIFISSYIMWLLASLHLLPFTRLSLLVIFLGFAALSIFLFSRMKDKGNARLPWRLIILEEILFSAALAFWSFVRATEPSIHSLEKYMDFGFVNSILRSTYFPPADMWLAKSPDYFSGLGGFINYYYFGHYITAFLTRLSGLDSAVTYNLMIATLFAFTFMLPFSLGMNLFYLFKVVGYRLHKAGDASDLEESKNSRLTVKYIIVGLLTAFLVSLGGNLHTIYVFTSGYPNESPQPPWQLEWGIHPERYWYPNATRFIPFTIHEFPIYSFVVADLHGHVSDIPLVMLTLALLLVLIVRRSRLSDLSNLGHLSKILAEFENHTSIPLPLIVFLGVLLACMYMTNAWDGLIYMILSCLVFLYLNLFRLRDKNISFGTGIYKTFSASLFLLFFFLLSSLPFSLNFKPFVSGIGVLCAPAALLGKKLGPFLFEVGKCQKSPLYMLAILWGFFYFNVVGFLLFIIIPAVKRSLFSEKTGDAKEGSQAKFHKEATIKKYLVKLGGLKRSLGNLSGRTRFTIVNSNPIDIFILLLILLSTLLLIFPEFFYVKDIYPAHYRANTMFKLGYQAFMMLGVTSAYIMFRIKQSPRKNILSFLFFVLCYLLFFLVAIYPYFAINSYYGNLQTYHGLYGLSWMADQYPDDYKAVDWMRKNIVGQSTIVEANGDSYTDYDRVSAYTGLPTIIGWPVHEWLWRGSYDEAGRRIPEVSAIYESTDLVKTQELLKKYNVSYIFVGQLEREKYKNLDETKLDSLGTVVFQSGKTKVIQLQSR